MKKITIDRLEVGDQMIIKVELPARKYARDPVQEFSNSELQEYLKQEGVILSDYELQSQTSKTLTSYDTKGQKPNLEGTWIFNKIKEKEKKSLNKKETQSYKKSKVKKSGD